MESLGLLGTGISGLKQRFLGMAVGLLLSIPVLAAVPLNDKELNNNYLTSRNTPKQMDIAQFNRVLSFKNPESMLMTFVPISGLSSLTFLLNEHDRKDVLNATNPYSSAWTFGENVAQDFDSEFYSLRWEGNYPDIYDISNAAEYYFNSTTGSYEINNISGNVQFEVSLRSSDTEVVEFKRRFHVFN